MRWLWITGGLASLGLGIVGIFVPLLPSTVFLLFASYAFARSSERLHTWLMSHPRFGPPIHNWLHFRAIERTAKRNATVVIVAGFLFSVAIGLNVWILLTQFVVLGAVTAFIWTRQEPAV